MTIEKATDGLSIAQAADRVGVHYQTIRNWINDGRLPVTRFGPRIVRIDPAHLDAMRTSPKPVDTPPVRD